MSKTKLETINHYGCNIDCTVQPIYCTDHEVNIESPVVYKQLDEDTQDWENYLTEMQED